MLKDWIKSNALIAFFVVFTGYFLYQLYSVQTRYNRIEKVINEDAWGYYIIAPALFEFNDPNFNFIDTTFKKNNNSQYFPPVVNTLENGQTVCKYYSGVALLQAPFYWIDRCLFPKDHFQSGLSFHRQMSILISSITYLLLACGLLMIILKRMGILPIWNMLLCSAVLFGSNLLSYATYDAAYSHVYSFFAIMLLIKCMQDINLKGIKHLSLFKLGLSLGLVIIIRPVNALAGLALLGFINHNLWPAYKQHWVKHSLYACLGIGLMISIQCSLWYWQTGKWLVYPYGQEKLNLLEPHVFEFVFGYNCGWALYTPLPFVLLCLSLVCFGLQKQWLKMLLVGGSSYLVIHVLSSWYYLHYGCTVGCRPITEFYGLIALAFAWSIKAWQTRGMIKTIGAWIVLLGLYFNHIVLFQFYEQIINWCEMDQKRYHMVWMKTHEAYKYASSPFWNFEALHPSSQHQSLKQPVTLNINAHKPSDNTDIMLPPLQQKDSAVLYTLFLSSKTLNQYDDAYLRLLLTDKGNYVDLLHLLLIRKIKSSPQAQAFTYQFHCSKTAFQPKLQINLESVDQKAETTVHLDSIWIQNIIKP